MFNCMLENLERKIQISRSYIDAFKYGSYPHAGAGIGMERVLMPSRLVLIVREPCCHAACRLLAEPLHTAYIRMISDHNRTVPHSPYVRRVYAQMKDQDPLAFVCRPIRLCTEQSALWSVACKKIFRGAQCATQRFPDSPWLPP